MLGIEEFASFRPMDPLAHLKLEPADYEEYDMTESVFVEDLGDHPEADLGGDEGGAQGAQAGVSEYGGVVEGEQVEPVTASACIVHSRTRGLSCDMLLIG